MHHHKHENRRRDDHRFARSPSDWTESGRHGERHGRHAGERTRRLFDHGELRFVLLHLIAEKPRHGYEIIKAIEERAGGAYSPSPGVIYPTLTMLEEQGYATLAEEAGKKLYALSETGAAFLRENQRIVDAVAARMKDAATARGDGPPPQVVRGVENLKLALRLRLSRGPLTDEQTRTIAAALDTAATTIEQV
jgi:DNA-binding PadR family transcriptional regulator